MGDHRERETGGRTAWGLHIRWDPTDRIKRCSEGGKTDNNAKVKGSKRPHAPYSKTLTILTRCPGVAVMSQVHSLRLGYLSGQLGLLRVPLGLWILCSHSAEDTHTHTHAHKEEVKIIAAQEKVRGNGKGTGRRETREAKERERISKEHILMTS